MMPAGARARNQRRPRRVQVRRRNVRQPRRGDTIEPDPDRRVVAPGQRQLVDAARRLLHPLVLEQPADQLDARILGLVARPGRRLGQQQARLDLDQHRGHQQVLGRELELRPAHHLDVAQVLAGELRHRDVEHVDVLPPDQIEQEVERALEGFEKDLQRLRRDVQVLRQLEHRLAVDLGDVRRPPGARGRANGQVVLTLVRSAVVEAHRLADVAHRLLGELARALATVGDDVAHQLRVVEVALRPLADRLLLAR